MDRYGLSLSVAFRAFQLGAGLALALFQGHAFVQNVLFRGVESGGEVVELRKLGLSGWVGLKRLRIRFFIKVERDLRVIQAFSLARDSSRVRENWGKREMWLA